MNSRAISDRLIQIIKPKGFKLGRGGTGNKVVDALACRLAKAYSLPPTHLRPARLAVGIGSDLERDETGATIISGLSKAVADETARLYLNHIVERIAFTGGLTIQGVSERSSMAERAKELGVPEEHIILDPNHRQHSTYEQAYSLPNLALQVFPQIQAPEPRNSVIVVDTSLHARRTRNFFKPVFSSMNIRFQMDPVFVYDHPTGRDSIQVLFKLGLIGYIVYEAGWNLPMFRALQTNKWFIEVTRSAHSDKNQDGKIR